MDDELLPLLQLLADTTGLDTQRSRRVVDDVIAFLSEQLEVFVKRRHVELGRQGLKNPAIYQQLQQEIEQRRFAAAAVTERQIRRMIYG